MNKHLFFILLTALLFLFTCAAAQDFPLSDNGASHSNAEANLQYKQGSQRDGKFIIDSTHSFLGNTFGQDWFHYQRYMVTERDQWGNFLQAGTFEYDTIENGWFPHQKYQATYFDSVTTSFWDAQVWDSKGDRWRMSDSIMYNQAGNPVINWYKIWDPVKFRFWRGQRIQYTYQDDILTNRIVQKFDTLSGNWKPDETYTYAYNEEGLLASELIMAWDSASNSFKNYSNIQFSYNENLVIQSEIIQFWSEGNEWVNNMKDEYAYFEETNKLKEKTHFTWVNNFGWDIISRTLFSYDINQRLIEALSQIWVEFENKWYNTASYSYVYNALGQRTEVLYRSWDFGGFWVNESNTLYTFDDDGNQTHYVFRVWDDNNNLWLNYYQGISFWSEFQPSAINEIPGAKIHVYPNPAKDVIHFLFQENPNPALVSVYTSSGKLLSQKPVTGQTGQMNISGFTNGNYLLVINAGNRIYTTIVIKN
jgi:hypothetical protein